MDVAVEEGSFSGGIVEEGDVHWARIGGYIANICHISVFPHLRPSFAGLGCTGDSQLHSARFNASQLLPYLLLALPAVLAQFFGDHLIDKTRITC